MAGGGARSPGLAAAQFERVRLGYLRTVTQELQDAAELMERLDRNLGAWARRAGQAEALAQVWSRFQTQLGTAELARSLLPPGALPPPPGPQ